MSPTILAIGTIASQAFPDWASPVESAGLVIEYMPSGSTSARRVAFGFSELGMWVEYEGETEAPKMRHPSQDDDQQ
jgi:hypothetical protein